MSDLVKVNAKEFGLEESKASQIAEQFKPMLDKMVELEKEYNNIIKLDIEDSETSKQAKELRLKYVKVRTGTASIHKEQKKFYLAGGKFVDGWKNAQLFASQGIESKLMDIEKHAENIEKLRVEKLGEERRVEMLKYTDDVPSDLGYMSDEIWSNYIAGSKLNYENRIASEKKAEEERLAKVKAEKEERERIAKENERLKAEAEEREKQLEKERLEREQKEALRLAAEQKEREEQELIKRKEREKQEALLLKERKERERVEKELREKQEAEAKAERQRIANEQAELNKGDAAKVKDLVSDLNTLKSKYSFKSAKNKKMYEDVSSLLDKVIAHIK